MYPRSVRTLPFTVACAVIAACGSNNTNGQPDAAPVNDAAVESAPPPIDAAPDADVDDLVSIATSPKPLTPQFSLDVFDYYVRCPAAQNAFTVTVTTTKGSTQTPVSFVPNEDYVVRGAYHIRCLPADFPMLTVTPHPQNGAPTPGYFLVNSFHYAMALDVRGTPVWYQRSNGFVIDVDSLAQNEISSSPNSELPITTDMKVSFQLLDLSTLATSTVASPDEPTDEHELRRLANGHFLVITNTFKNIDLTGLGTFGEAVVSGIEELDASKTVVWSWSATDHIDPLQECVQPDGIKVGTITAGDVFHCNSIDVDATGNLLVSCRNTSAVYYVDKATGTIVWKLGGTAYNKDGAELVAVTGDPETTFRLQHDARILSSGHVTMFDDNANGSKSRGVEYALDHVAHTATVAWQYAGTGGTMSQGSFRRYADGHSVIGWGSSTTPRVLSEVDAQGNDVLDVDFGSTLAGPSYRAVKVPTSQLDIALMRASAGK
jgi:hypothetical protein